MILKTSLLVIPKVGDVVKYTATGWHQRCRCYGYCLLGVTLVVNIDDFLRRDLDEDITGTFTLGQVKTE